jgi:hypothetical protein
MLLHGPRGTKLAPDSPYKINGSDFASKGLVFAFSGHHGLDLISGTRPVNTATTEVATYNNSRTWNFTGAVGSSQLDFGTPAITSDLGETPATWAFLATTHVLAETQFACQSDNNSQAGWNIGFRNGTALGAEMPGSSGNLKNFISESPSLDTPFTFIVTFDGGALAAGIKCYLNGRLGTPTGGTDLSGVRSAATAEHLLLGRRRFNNAASHNGTISVALIANRVWSESEARAFHNNPYSVFQPLNNIIYSFSSLPQGPIIGSSDIVFTTTGTELGTGVLSGSNAIVFTGSGTELGSGALVGNSAITFASNANISVSIVGSASMAFTSSGTELGAGALSATADINFAGSATASGTAMASATIIFANNATLDGAGVLSGAGAIIFSGSDVLRGSGVLSTIGSIVFSGTATAQPPGAMSAAAGITFGINSTLHGSVAAVGLNNIVFAGTLVSTMVGTSVITFSHSASMSLAAITLSGRSTITFSTQGHFAPQNSNPRNNFSAQQNILNFKPDIYFIEPEQIEEDKLPQLKEAPTLNEIKADVVNLISNYKDIENIANDIQDEIDQRAANVSIKLDPVHDSFILEAVRRHFNDPKKTEITYDDYLHCINHINETGSAGMPVVNQQDIISATNDQYRDIFGSLGLPSGLARPELADHAQMIKPIDLTKFTGEQLSKLITILTPDINKLIIKKIKELNPF